MVSKKPRHRGVQIIGGFKLFKGILLIAVASGLVGLLHKDVEATVTHWMQVLNFDINSHYSSLFLEKVLKLSPDLPLLTAVTFVYGGIFVTEGIGLLLGKRWAEYLTVIVTASFLPLEGYEIFKEASVGKGITIAVNLAIVVYLIVRLKKDKPERESR